MHKLLAGALSLVLHGQGGQPSRPLSGLIHKSHFPLEIKQIPGLSCRGGNDLNVTRSVSISEACGQEETLERRGRKCPRL